MADQKLQLTVTAKDLASGTIKQVDKSTKGLTGSFGSLKSLLIGGIGLSGLVIGFKATTKAASDLEEANSKLMTVFRGVEGRAREMVQVLVDGYAVSTREASQFLAGVQDLLVPLGFARDRAGEFSFEIVKLAADLGSFNNMRTEDVIRDINSALTGSFETMKKYGVVLNETVIKQRAMNNGLFSGKGVVDAQTKALVAMELILEGTSDAQGDMARTSEGWANQTKQLTAAIEDTLAALGKFIIESELVRGALKGIIAELKDFTNLLKGVANTQQKVAANQKLIGDLTDELKKKQEALTRVTRVYNGANEKGREILGKRRKILEVEIQIIQEDISRLNGQTQALKANTQAKKENNSVSPGGGGTGGGDDKAKKAADEAKKIADARQKVFDDAAAHANEQFFLEAEQQMEITRLFKEQRIAEKEAEAARLAAIEKKNFETMKKIGLMTVRFAQQVTNRIVSSKVQQADTEIALINSKLAAEEIGQAEADKAIRASLEKKKNAQALSLLADTGQAIIAGYAQLGPVGGLVNQVFVEGLALFALSDIQAQSYQTRPGQFKEVPGPASQPVPAILHGGEKVGRFDTGSMGGITINIQGDVLNSDDTLAAINDGLREYRQRTGAEA